MSIIKGIFKYAIILVMIAVGVCVIGLAVMMFTGVTLFGYKYVSYSVSNSVIENNVNSDYISLVPGTANYYGEFDSIHINAPDMNVTVTNGVFDYVGLSAKINVKGFVNVNEIDGLIQDEDLGPQIFKIYEPFVSERTLYFSVKTGEGLLSYSSNNVVIKIPAHNSDFVIKDITVDCEDGSFRMVLDEDALIDTGTGFLTPVYETYPVSCTGTLSVTTTTGDQIVKGVKVNNFTSKTLNGDVVVSNLASTFTYDGDDFNGLTGSFAIENERGDITFGSNTHIAGGCAIKSINSKIKLNNVFNDATDAMFNYEGSDAHIELNDIYGVAKINSANAILKLNSVKKSATDFAELSINQGKKFSLDIQEIDGTTVNVVTESGYVNIGSLKSNMTDITTKSGNVSIAELYSCVKVITTNGNVEINQQDINQVSATDTIIDVQTVKGNVNISNISSVLKLKTTGNAAVKLKYAHIYADSFIQNGDGNLEIEVPYEKYVISTHGAGSFDVKIAQVEYTNSNTSKISFVSLTEQDVEVVQDGENTTYTEIGTGNILKIMDIESARGQVDISNNIA